jgi:hypothetical protein
MGDDEGGGNGNGDDGGLGGGLGDDTGDGSDLGDIGGFGGDTGDVTTDEGGILGPPDASTSALTDALDQPVLEQPVIADVESGASQLLSTAFRGGLSNPSSLAQGEGFTTMPTTDPYANVATGGGNLYAFTGGNVEVYNGIAPVEESLDWFPADQNVAPNNGMQDADWSSGGESPSLTSSMLTFGDIPGDISQRVASNDLVKTHDESYVFPFVPDIEATDVASDAGNVLIDGAGPIDIEVPYFSTNRPGDPNSPVLGLTLQPTPTSDPTPSLTPTQSEQLEIAIQQAVEAYDPNFFDSGQPGNISDVLSGTGWEPLLGNPGNLSLDSISQPFATAAPADTWLAQQDTSPSDTPLENPQTGNPTFQAGILDDLFLTQKDFPKALFETAALLIKLYNVLHEDPQHLNPKQFRPDYKYQADYEYQAPDSPDPIEPPLKIEPEDEPIEAGDPDVEVLGEWGEEALADADSGALTDALEGLTDAQAEAIVDAIAEDAFVTEVLEGLSFLLL